MSKGLVFDPLDRSITIVNGSRVVQTTHGKMVAYIPAQVSHLSQAVVFPHPSTDIAYIWTYSVVFNNTPAEQHAESATCYITALPAETEVFYELEDAPDGADFFQGLVRLHRSVAPSHTWKGRTLDVRVIENQWLPWGGSALLEYDLKFTRIMSVVIVNDPLSPHYRKLCIRLKQSIGPKISGYGAFGNGPPLQATSTVGGGEMVVNSQQGTPFVRRSGFVYGYTANNPHTVVNKSAFTLLRKGGPSAVASDDNTAMGSTYVVDIVGNYGRRS